MGFRKNKLFYFVEYLIKHGMFVCPLIALYSDALWVVVGNVKLRGLSL